MRIKFLSLNLLQGGLLFENIKTFLKEENPDILCLQEVNDCADQKTPEHYRSMTVLQELLPDFHSYFSSELQDIRDDGTVETGNAIFSRYPITDKKTVFYDVPYQVFHDVESKSDF